MSPTNKEGSLDMFHNRKNVDTIATHLIEGEETILILKFCVPNLLNSVLQKKRTGVEPHYFDIWEPAHQGNAGVEEGLVTISFYSYAIFVIFILNSIFCRNAIRRS
jgi:hypothetical protein